MLTLPEARDRALAMRRPAGVTHVAADANGYVSGFWRDPEWNDRAQAWDNPDEVAGFVYLGWLGWRNGLSAEDARRACWRV